MASEKNSVNNDIPLEKDTEEDVFNDEISNDKVSNENNYELIENLKKDVTQPIITDIKEKTQNELQTNDNVLDTKDEKTEDKGRELTQLSATNDVNDSQSEKIFSRKSSIEKPKRVDSAPHKDSISIVESNNPIDNVDSLKKKVQELETSEIQGNVTVKFEILGGQETFTERYDMANTIQQIKMNVAVKMNISDDALLLYHERKNEGNELDEKLTIGQLGATRNGVIELAVASNYQNVVLHKPKQVFSNLGANIVTVKYKNEMGEERDIVVCIDSENYKKPFLGGYIDKKSNTEYHHAVSQTLPKKLIPKNNTCFSRDCQTIKEKNIALQTHNHMSTQMTGVNVYVSTRHDKIHYSSGYTTADEIERRRMEKIVIIQKYYRRACAVQKINILVKMALDRVEWEKKQMRDRRGNRQQLIQNEFNRRTNPKTRADFNLLYNALEKWWHGEYTKINENLFGAERKAALCELLEQETTLIASIGKHRNNVHEENEDRSIKLLLNKMSKPKSWSSYKNVKCSVDTPYTIRARELFTIYKTLQMKCLTQDERLDILLSLKQTIKEHDCTLVRDIMDLIDREADLMIRKVKKENLEGLRQRITTLFLQYIKNPTFNPEAVRYSVAPQDHTTLYRDIYYCKGCQNYMKSTNFSNDNETDRCKNCQLILNRAILRKDFTKYKTILNKLRKNEQRNTNASKIPYLLKENDIKYIMEQVWRGQSILSGWNDIDDLIICRWNINEPWSPWNMIVLSLEESVAHEQIDNVSKVYDENLIFRVQQKHILAKSNYSRLVDTN